MKLCPGKSRWLVDLSWAAQGRRWRDVYGALGVVLKAPTAEPVRSWPWMCMWPGGQPGVTAVRWMGLKEPRYLTSPKEAASAGKEEARKGTKPGKHM